MSGRAVPMELGPTVVITANSPATPSTPITIRTIPQDASTIGGQSALKANSMLNSCQLLGHVTWANRSPGHQTRVPLQNYYPVSVSSTPSPIIVQRSPHLCHPQQSSMDTALRNSPTQALCTTDSISAVCPSPAVPPPRTPASTPNAKLDCVAHNSLHSNGLTNHGTLTQELEITKSQQTPHNLLAINPSQMNIIHTRTISLLTTEHSSSHSGFEEQPHNSSTYTLNQKVQNDLDEDSLRTEDIIANNPRWKHLGAQKRQGNISPTDPNGDPPTALFIARSLESRTERSCSLSLFKIKRLNSGHKSNRRQSDSSLGLLQSKPSPLNCPAVTERNFSVSSERPTVDHKLPVEGLEYTRRNPSSSNQRPGTQQHSLTRQSTGDFPPELSTNQQLPLASEQVELPIQSSLFAPRENASLSKERALNKHGDMIERERTSVSGEPGIEPVNRQELHEDSLASLTNDPRSRTCCFCWCCCCSCSCMRVRASLQDSKRPSSSLDPQSRLDEQSMEEKLPYDEIKSWGESFDLLMQCPAGRKVFREFLRSEYSEENIMFWLACEELKQESNPELVEEKARMIYEDFISILSPREVSLDSRVREIINANMIEPTPHTFDEAQMQVYTLMHRDSYLRFLNSRIYKDLLHRACPFLSNSSLD
ncbi:hypothetical protein CRM22_008821 [Opisthorchis felineus]|uniref:RGS domain-containing protein n=1 Tax=Opisthorchis felineus TaxID=147828 RepID=A0A4S2LA62_OPIFE|nr:hypothetical protein CRM22_008821 [Opisthorchis felineus]